jgi:DNA-binding CsgD family transcriptional regulator
MSSDPLQDILGNLDIHRLAQQVGADPAEVQQAAAPCSVPWPASRRASITCRPSAISVDGCATPWARRPRSGWPPPARTWICPTLRPMQSTRSTWRRKLAAAEERRGPAGLTAREAQVLGLIAEGATTREVSERLFISAKTADNHIQHIYTKLGVTNRAGATRWALEHGLVEPAAD